MGMVSVGERLRQARKNAGYETAASAAAAIGISRYTYSQHENGTREVPRDGAIRYSRMFRVSVDWLYTGRGRGPIRFAPVVGYVGAGAEVHPFDDFAQGQGLEHVEPPPTADDCVAAKIRGDSMYPLRDGWLIFWQRRHEGVAEDCVGALCIAQIKDGPLLLKEIRRGSRKGLWRLESWNAPPREDVTLDWASRVIDIRPS